MVIHMKRVIALLLILLAAAAAVGAAVLQRRLAKVPENPPSTLGNTPGNINNGGVFCEVGDEIFFANPYDNEYLYKMNMDLTGVKKVMDVPVSMLNGAGKFVYYYQKANGSATGLGYIQDTHGVTRIQTNGKNPKELDKGAMTSIMLIGNALYTEYYNKLEDRMNLYSISLDGKNKEILEHYWINPAGAQNGNIYYNGTENDHNLYLYNTQTHQSVKVYDGDVWYPTPEGEYIYFLDVADDYSLCRISMLDQSVQTLTTDRVDLFNVRGSYIYYSRNSKKEPALMRMRTDGSETEMIASGVYEKLSTVGNYLFFRGFGRYDTYYILQGGPVMIQNFVPVEEKK